MEDYPELDEAFLNELVLDYEGKKDKPSIEQDKDLEVPLPPEANHNLYDLPSFDDAPILEAKEIAPNKEFVPKTQGFPVDNDVENLSLLENVFDKRVTDDEVRRQIISENNKNDSGRLLDTEDVEVKTELNDAEILNISKLRFIADRYNVQVLDEFTHNLMTLKISRNRKGRSEFIQGLHADEKRDHPPESFFSRIFGGSSR